MAPVFAMVLMLSQLRWTLSANTAGTDAAPGPAGPNQNGTTEAPAKRPSQKELLRSVGQFDFTNSAPQKPIQSQKSLLGDLGSFSLTSLNSNDQASAKPSPQTCIVTDVCQAMNGICNHGTCVHIEKNCEGDFRCECNPGYKGQFCSVRIEAETTSAAPTPSTTATPATNAPKNSDKTHVNGNIDTSKIVADNNTNVGNSKMSADIGKNGSGKIKSKDTFVADSFVFPKKIGSADITNGQDTGRTSDTTKVQADTVLSNSGINLTTDGVPKQKDGSYRKGPEAAGVADNSPISLANTQLGSHKIKEANMSIISQTTDTVTFATVSVRKTFLGTVLSKTTAEKDSIAGKGSKQQQEKASIAGTRTTAKPTTTTESSHTKELVVDSTKNVSSSVLTKSKTKIKDPKQTIVSEAEGFVDIHNKNIDVTYTKTNNGVANKIDTRSEKGVKEDKSPNIPSAQSASKSSKSSAKHHQSSPTKPSVNDKQLTPETIQHNAGAGADKNNANETNIANAKMSLNDVSGKSNANNKNDNLTNGTNGDAVKNPSVFSPIVDLLQKLQDPALVQKSLDALKVTHPETPKTADAIFDATANSSLKIKIEASSAVERVGSEPKSPSTTVKPA